MAVGVLGAGALGLSCALRLAQAGVEVVVLEREPVPGGLAAGFPVGDAYLERFYHHLFRTDTTAVALIEELGLGPRLLWGQPTTAVLYQGRCWPLDSPLAVLRFAPLPLLDRLRLGAGAAYLKAVRDYRRLPPTTAAAWLRRRMGPRVYARVWEPQLRGKFGDYAETIALPWFWARVHCRTPRLGYLRGGFHHLYTRLAEAITARGGRVELGREVTAIAREPDGTLRVATAAGIYRFEQLAVTLPTRLFLRLAPTLPAAYRARWEPGPVYLGAHCVVLALERPLLRDVYWLSVTDPGFPFLAVVEHTNFLSPADYGGRHLVYLGNYLPMDHPLYRQSDAQVLAEFVPHLRRLNPAFTPEWVREAWVWKAPYAQPVVTCDYLRQLPPHTTPWPGVFLANMAHVYPQDRGQNYSIRLGERLAQLVLAAARAPAGAGVEPAAAQPRGRSG
ncbi:MAG TPA: NAD(P)/FAD-dependent oxidoreductase [Chloroflexota bacterium]|jgi:protoporphyrinogen oxidase|nr:NAD(P)/FAD-dependent oxidoreductase [Chloroflexota bacterium]